MALSTAAKEQAIRDLGAERAIATGEPPQADAGMSRPPIYRKWVSTCGHTKRIQIGSMEYEDAEQNGWSYCNRNGCKDTLAGQWADAPKKGAIVNGKPAAKATKATTPKPAASKAAKKTTASRARKAADTLPNKVRQHREAADLSPKELAQRLGTDWTASTVRRIERGARKATIGQMAELGTALGQPASVLFPASAAEQAEAKATALPQVPLEKPGKAAPKPATKGKPVGKRTGKVINSTAAFKEEVGAILGA